MRASVLLTRQQRPKHDNCIYDHTEHAKNVSACLVVSRWFPAKRCVCVRVCPDGSRGSLFAHPHTYPVIFNWNIGVTMHAEFAEPNGTRMQMPFCVCMQALSIQNSTSSSLSSSHTIRTNTNPLFAVDVFIIIMSPNVRVRVRVTRRREACWLDCKIFVVKANCAQRIRDV